MTFPVDWIDNVPTDQEARTQDLHLRRGDVYFIIHHSVTTRVQDTIATFKSPREVSANFAIGPIVTGGDDIKVVLAVPESRRAWTSASSLDDRALTTEVCDKALGGNYPISENAKHILARIAAYMHVEYGMPLDRVHILTHQEVYARGYGSYATACAGPDMQASMDAIVAEAIQLLSAPPTDTALLRRQKEDTMYVSYPGNPSTVYAVGTDANNKPRMRVIGANEAAFARKGGLVIDAGADADGARTLENLGRECGYTPGGKNLVIPTVQLATDKEN